VKLNVKRLKLQLSHLWAIARGSGSNTAETIMVELIGADGTVGWGEAAPIARYKESLDTVEAFLKKVDARGLTFNDVEGSMTYLNTVSPHDMSAKCALNIALLDGAGEANACVHGRLISSPLRSQVTPQQPQSSKP
jgi:L-alanine-DL-glutamate epimerase-like enolase superfamily enzyme